jgi:hypothetical protein
VVAWIDAARDARFDETRAELSRTVERGMPRDSFAALHEKSSRYGKAIATFIEIASRREVAGLAVLRQRAAARLIGVIR